MHDLIEVEEKLNDVRVTKQLLDQEYCSAESDLNRDDVSSRLNLLRVTLDQVWYTLDYITRMGVSSCRPN